MTDNRTTKLLRKMLDERGVEHIDNDDERDETTEPLTTTWEYTQCGYEMVVTATEVRDVDNKPYLDMDFHHLFTPEQAIAATLGDEKPKKCCSTCQYRYVTGQRPYPTFGYMCGFGDGKRLCGDNRSVLNHMGCEHWEKELK